MKLARAIHFDESDQRVFASPARTGEWCIPGGFEFSNWTEADLTGKARQAFANGWLGLETGGRVTFVAVTQVEPAEAEAISRLGLAAYTMLAHLLMAIPHPSRRPPLTPGIGPTKAGRR